MNDVIENKMQTPIEIALGIDENGMTTARKLYAFLELRQGDFARWCKRNITGNEFAEENTDYIRLRIDAEMPNGGKIQRDDYKLSAGFAKKLSMMSKSEKGEQARKYFVTVEDGMKELASRFQNMSPELRAVLVVDQRVTRVEKKTDTLEDRFNKLEADMPVFTIDAKNIQNAVKKKGVEILGGKESNAYNDKSTRTSVYADIQCMLRRNFGVKRYEEIKHKQADIAIRLVEEYVPPLILQEKVDMENAQMRFV
nr:ORF6C domain-containing protein [uncultured Blautia sp.]